MRARATDPASRASHTLDALLRGERGRILSVLIRGFGDFDLAEDVLQDAIAAALERWPADGAPSNPAGWLVTTARRRAIDRLRKSATRARNQDALRLLEALRSEEAEADAADATGAEEEAEPAVGDERLRLLFTCCHPALALPARVALTLRTLGGLATPEIARAFLVPEATMAQRLVRAKRKIRDAGIPYAVPAADRLSERLDGVLAVVYLIFNEAYAATAGDGLGRPDLAAEAVRLAELLVALLPDEPEPRGLLALLLYHDARGGSRTAPDGSLVLLEDQDRGLWDRARIRRANAVLEAAIAQGRPGPYQLQAAIAGLHANAPSAAHTDWPAIASLYDRLVERAPSPVVALNRAVAVALAQGDPAAGLALVDALDGLDAYHPYHATRGELLHRLDRPSEAAAAWRRALERTRNPAERALLRRRLEEVAR